MNNKIIKSNQILILLLSVSICAPVLSQVALEEIIVTARKRAESFEDVPVAINVFSEDEIESAGIETPHDFIALTPNATIVQTQNAGNSFIVVRGISQARNSEPSVAVLYDGVLMANPAQFNQELFDIEQIEFLKGPQGALYGKNAIGGAITINTKQPTDEFEGKIKVGGDSGPGYKVQAGLSGPVPGTDDLKFRASFSYKDTDGYIGNPFLNEEADPYKDVSGRLKLLWTPAENFTADLRFSRSEMDTQAFYFNIVANVNDTSLPVRVNNAGENKRDLMNISLKMDYEMEMGTFTSITSYDEVDELLTGDAFDFLPTAESFNANFLSVNILGLPRGSIPDFNQSQYLEVEAISQEIRFTSPGDRRFRWIAGAYLIATERFISTGNMVDTGGGVFPVFRNPRGNFPFDFATDPVNPQATFLSDSQDNFAWALFGEIAYDVSDNFEMAFSLRYDHDTRENTTETPNAFFAGTLVGASFNGQVRERTWDDLQPKISLRWKPMDNLTLYSTVSRGFRSGGFNQAGVAAAGVLGVEDAFNQETANTFEIGAKAQFFDGKLKTGFAAYHTNAEGSYYFVFLVDSSTQNLG
ncbi:MAG: iron complex outermembrane receptor protein, partial [Gammaproteobacteria bacterium]